MRTTRRYSRCTKSSRRPGPAALKWRELIPSAESGPRRTGPGAGEADHSLPTHSRTETLWSLGDRRYSGMAQGEQRERSDGGATLLTRRAPRPWPVLIRRLVDEFVLVARNHDIGRGGVRVYENDEKGERVFLIVVRVPADETRVPARPMGRGR